MRTIKWGLRALMITAIASAFVSCSDSGGPVSTSQAEAADVDGYILVLDNAAVKGTNEVFRSVGDEGRRSQVHSALTDLLRDHGLANAEPRTVWSNVLLGGVVVLTPDQARRIKGDSRVLRLERDRKIPMIDDVVDFGIDIALNTENQNVVQSGGQDTSWGVVLLGGPRVPTSGITVWIIDTGIDLDHPDLNVDIARSKSFNGWTADPDTGQGSKPVRSSAVDPSSPDDANGHGTRSAGIVGAKDNGVGTVGLAPGVSLVSLRISSQQNGASWATVLDAFDHVAGVASPGDVVNYSFSSLPNDDHPIRSAVLAAADRGIRIVIAAGNDKRDVTGFTPAGINHPNVFTVAAMEKNANTGALQPASYSNYGSPIDYWAPGSSRTTTKDGKYEKTRGTSIAAPHIAGLLASGAVRIGGQISKPPRNTTSNWAKRQ